MWRIGSPAHCASMGGRIQHRNAEFGIGTARFDPRTVIAANPLLRRWSD
jgi:hypothetical protein